MTSRKKLSRAALKVVLKVDPAAAAAAPTTQVWDFTTLVSLHRFFREMLSSLFRQNSLKPVKPLSQGS